MPPKKSTVEPKKVMPKKSKQVISESDSSSNDSDSDHEIDQLSVHSVDTVSIPKNNINIYKFNNEIIKMFEKMNSTKQEFVESVGKFEKYTSNRIIELEQSYEDRKFNTTSEIDNLKKSYQESQQKLKKTYDETKQKIEKDIEVKTNNINQKHEDKCRELQKEYEMKEYQFKHNYTKMMDDMEREKEKNGYTFALSALKQRNEVPIKSDELAEKNQKLAKIMSEHATEIKKLEETLKARHTKEMAYELEKIKLTNTSNVATITAQNEQKSLQIEVLNETIASLKKELAEQRTLTKQVAEASRQGQIVQNMGKS